MEFPSDAQKIDKIKLLIDNGFSDRLLLSLDIHTKHRMVSPPIPRVGANAVNLGPNQKLTPMIIIII